MPSSKKPTPEQLQSGAADLVDVVSTLLAQLRQMQGQLIEIGKTVGMSWPEVGAAMGCSKDAARGTYNRWKAGQ
jgi:hypothetical protein